jgi:hypothetical protein
MMKFSGTQNFTPPIILTKKIRKKVDQIKPGFSAPPFGPDFFPGCFKITLYKKIRN